MLINRYKCDICGTEVDSLSGWYFGRQLGNTIFISRSLQTSQDSHLCGRACAIKYANRFLESSKELDDSSPIINHLNQISLDLERKEK